MKNMIIKGRKIKGNPLSGLIPEKWKVQTFDSETHYTVEVHGTALLDSEWDDMLELFKSEFGDNLYEVYSDIPNGELFDVYLKSSVDM
jgi:hypothetical protein